MPKGIPAAPAASNVPDSRPADLSTSRPSATARRPNWSQWISPVALEDEIKSIVPDLSDAVRSSRRFNGGGFRKVSRQLGWLAALFGTIAEYDGQVRWQESAAALRDQIAAAAVACQSAGDTSHEQAKRVAADLADLVRGGRIDLPKAEAQPTWADLVDRRAMMSRMETAEQERLGPWTQSEEPFERNAESLAREAEVLALISKLISDESFDYADEDEYRQSAEQLLHASGRLIKALEERDLSEAQSAVGAVNQSCSNCHDNYR